MARRRGPGCEPQPSNSRGALDACRICLACIGGITAPFSREVLDCALPCTGTKDTACQITQHLSTWNEVLIEGRYELRERPRTRPELELAITAPFIALNDSGTLMKVATLLYLLIKRHHCVTAMHLAIGRLKEYDVVLCDALRGNERIQSLTLVDFTDNGDAYQKFFSVIPSLQNLKHFQYTTDAGLQQAHLQALASTLEETNALESLHIPHLWIRGIDSTDVLTAISAYTSLRELSINFSFCEHALEECCDAFSEYLKNSCTLATLSFYGFCNFLDPRGKVIVQGLCESKCILKLNLDEVMLDNEALELFARIFERNTVLRSFHIHPDFECCIAGGGYCDSWLPSLTSNDTIEEMTLPFHVWRAEQWLQLFRALSTMRSLKRITIGWRHMSEADLNVLCEAVCESGVEEKVAFGPEFLVCLCGNNFNLLRCKSFVNIQANYAASSPQFQEMVAVISELNHVTSFKFVIIIKTSDDDPLRPVAALIGSTTRLKTLGLMLRRDMSANYANLDWGATIQSLSSNQSITKLHITSGIMNAQEMGSLADVIRRSEYIRRLCIKVGDDRLPDLFPRYLSIGIADNYSLVSVRSLEDSDQDTFAIRDTARRNNGLVARASQFQAGVQLERTTAAALERVLRHRALLEEFADVECISVEEAAASLRAPLRPFDDMNSFMRMVGVVRACVECHARPDGRTQLDDLNEPCWRALRRCLFLDFVVM